MSRPVVDEQPESEFLRKMREAWARRLAATTVQEKRAIEREMEVLLRANRTRSAWDAAAESDAVECVDVPRGTSRDRSCPPSVGESENTSDDSLYDHKRAAARDVD